MDIYAKNILEHYKTPCHFGSLSDATASCREANRNCGDDIVIHIKLEADILSAVKFQGCGCMIAVGTASILTNYLTGKKADEVLAMGLDDIKAMLGIEITTRREKCALISLSAVQSAIRQSIGG